MIGFMIALIILVAFCILVIVWAIKETIIWNNIRRTNKENERMIRNFRKIIDKELLH